MLPYITMAASRLPLRRLISPILLILALSTAMHAVNFVPAAMVSPANGTVLPGSLVTFTWSPGAGVTDYFLCVSHVAVGQCEIYNIDQNTLDPGLTYSHSIAGLPTDGGPIYVTLSSQASNGQWTFANYTYTAAGGSFVPARISSPTATALTSTSVNFQWSGGAGVSDYWLYVSNVAQGHSEIYSGEQGLATSAAVSGLPATGGPLYVRLASKNSATAAWSYVDYTYTAPGTFGAASMISPSGGSTLTGPSTTFYWNSGVAAFGYSLAVSKVAAGNTDIYGADQGTALSAAVNGLPVDGSTVYVRLGTKDAPAGAWHYQDYTYTAATPTGNGVTFLGTDYQTQGTWNGVYGQDGGIIAQTYDSPPGYATWDSMSTTNLAAYQAFSSDPRAMLQPQYHYDLGSREISHFYNRYYMEFKITASDAQSHRLALYFSDWQPLPPLAAFTPKRSITVRVRDTATNAILDTRILTDYSSGVYLVYRYTGNVTIHIANNYPPVDTDGVTRDLPNGTVSAFYWGGDGLPTQHPTPSLSVSSTHTGNFTQGQNGATYSLSVANAGGAGATFSATTVTDNLPSGLTLVSMSGSGWTCSANACSRSDALAPGSSYPPITATVNVASDAGTPLANQVWVSGGGSSTASATDSTVIVPVVPITITTNPSGQSLVIDGATVVAPQAVNWAAGTSHTVAATSPQGTGSSRVVFTTWSDGGAQSHTITTPSAGTTYTANFKTQYLLTTAVSPANSGTLTPTPAGSSGYYDAGATVQLTAAPSNGYVFSSFSGDLSGSTNPQNITMSAAHTVTANFGPANLPPTLGTVTPSSGSGATQSFAATYSSNVGFADVQWAQMLFAVATNGGGQSYCFVHYDVQGNGFWLYGDGGFFVGPVAPGTVSNRLQNSLCAIDTSHSTVSGSGNTLTVTAALVFKGAGARNVYLRAMSVEQLDSGWQQKGTWTLAAAPMGTLSLNPSSGTGSTQTFTLTYPDPSGFAGAPFGWSQFLVGAASDGGGQPFCFVHYDRAGNGLWMYSGDVGYFVGPVTPGTASNTLSSSSCSVNTAGATVTNTSGNLVVSVPVTLKAPMSGAKKLFQRTLDVLNRDSGWQQTGTWNIP